MENLKLECEQKPQKRFEAGLSVTANKGDS